MFFQDSRSLKCLYIRTENRSISEFLINHTFRRYISIARAGWKFYNDAFRLLFAETIPYKWLLYSNYCAVAHDQVYSTPPAS